MTSAESSEESVFNSGWSHYQAEIKTETRNLVCGHAVVTTKWS